MVEYAGPMGTAVRVAQYRYELTRDWSPLQHEPGEVCWIMLNPSTADEQFNDATVRRCIRFSQRWGYSRLTVVNLFALIATNPADLHAAIRRDPLAAVGPDDDAHIQSAAGRAALVVCAWGAQARPYPARTAHVRALIAALHRPTRCLGLTTGGEPLHPLMLPYAATLEEYR